MLTKVALLGAVALTSYGLETNGDASVSTESTLSIKGRPERKVALSGARRMRTAALIIAPAAIAKSDRS